MLSVFVILGCFFAGLIAGVEIGSKETLRQLDEDINF